MEEWQALGAQFLTILVMVYGLLLVVGAPFGRSTQLANGYVKWLARMFILVISLGHLGRKKKRKGRNRRR